MWEDLFITFHGVEAAVFPWLYPTSDFTDTGIIEHYKHLTGDSSLSSACIGTSFMRTSRVTFPLFPWVFYVL